jgi:hypothetical protein
MVRTLTPTTQKDQRRLLLPGSAEAEPWEAWTTGPGAECVQAGQRPDDLAGGRGAALALPVAEVLAVPLWLREIDPKQFRGIIALELESRGLQSRGREAVFDWSVVAEEETRTLVLVGVLPALLPEELETDTCRIFEVSARCLPLPGDALVLWKERDRLVVAVTRQESLACFHALGDATPTTRVLQDLTCFLAALRMQGVIGTLKEAVLWTEASLAEKSALQALLHLPIREEARPAPVLPRETWNLTPVRVGEVKRGRVARRWRLRAAALGAFVLVAIGLGFGLRLFLAQRDVAQLQQWQASHAASLDMVHQTAAAWHDLQPVVQPDSYPLEVLLHVSESLPTDQVHLTLFETEGDHLLIKAEARNLTAAFQFFDALKKNPHLSTYTWEMAQPHSLANDITQLQVEGTRAAHD